MFDNEEHDLDEYFWTVCGRKVLHQMYTALDDTCVAVNILLLMYTVK